MTIREIADLAGVSIATVSRVLNGRDDVADETRELVRRVVGGARLHGEPQRPRPVGRAHRPRRRARAARVPGVLLRDPLRRDRGAVRAGPAGRALADRPRARARGLAARPARARRYRRRAHRPAGGVERRARAAARRGLSLRRHRSAPAARRSHPVGLGRAHVGRRPGDAAPARRSGTAASPRSPGPTGWVATEDRRRGYHAALAAAGILPDPALEAEADFEIGGGRAAARSAPRPRRPADGDLRVQRQPRDRRDPGGARARGLRVPEDLSVVGFDDVEHATIVTPALTTVRQPLAEMGRTAVSLLDAPARAPALRDAARRARDATRRSRVDRAAAGRSRARRIRSRR